MVSAQNEGAGERRAMSPHHVLPGFAVPKDLLAAEPVRDCGPAGSCWPSGFSWALPLLSMGMADVIKRKIVAFKEFIFEGC